MKENAQLFIEYESKANTWIELKNELISEYGKKINSAIIHQRLRERTKKKDETVTKYMYEMLSLGAQANVEQAAIISYIIDGLPGSPELKTFLLGADEINEFKKKLQDYETLQSKLSLQKGSTSGRKEDQSHRRKCYNCGEVSHVGNDCPTKNLGPRCYKCHQNGHVSSCCPQGAPQNPRINILQQITEKNDEDDENVDEIQMSPSDEERMHKKLYFQFKSRLPN